jgi:NAD-dependent dihydropyrimidine dehydrogenase PreA subunit
MTKALRVVEEGDSFWILVASERCTRHACMKCEMNCKEEVFRFDELEFEPGKKAW